MSQKPATGTDLFPFTVFTKVSGYCTHGTFTFLKQNTVNSL